jgi:hypothetical protein
MPDDRSRTTTTAGLALLAGALVVAAALLADGVRTLGRRSESLAVTGSARRPITADLGTWRGTITVQGADLAAAYGELQRHVGAVRTWLKARGLADSVVIVRPVETARMMVMNANGVETGQLAGYRLTQGIAVTLRDPRAIEVLAQDIGALAADGVPLSAEAPQYLFTRLGELRVQMMGEATADARARAETIAKAAGASVGDIRSAETGVVQITPRFSTEVSDYGMNDVTTIEKDITTVVRVTFSLR